MEKNYIGIIIIISLLILLTIILPVFVLPTITSTYLLVINPIGWSIVCLLTHFMYKDYGVKKIFTRGSIIKLIIITTLEYIIIYYLLGIFFGFLKTPYSHTFKAIFKNIISILLVVILQEYVRFKLINSCNKNRVIYVIVTLVFILVNIDWNNVSSSFLSNEEAFKYISSNLFPKILESILCTYLVIHATNIASTIYRGTLTLCLILVPVVPDLNWFFYGLFVIIATFYIFVRVNYEIKRKDKMVTRIDIKKEKPTTYILFLTILIVSVCFIAGVFRYMPVAIVSNSMFNKFSRGDIVIIEKLNMSQVKDIKVGDIIQYKLETKYIVHRVIEVVDFEKKIYRTKGDNNNVADTKLVKKEQVTGKVKFVIPYLGYPSVYFSELLMAR